MTSSDALQQKVKIVDNYSIMEWDPPQSMWGKTLAELQLPYNYNVRMILVKHHAESSEHDGHIKPTIPGSDYRVADHDTLIICGRNEDLGKLA